MYYNLKFNAGCLATRIGEQDKFEVICPPCGTTIGVMTGKEVSLAIMLTLGRGGVLCPACRATTCDFCGEQKDVYGRRIGESRELKLVCGECEKGMWGVVEMVNADWSEMPHF